MKRNMKQQQQPFESSFELVVDTEESDLRSFAMLLPNITFIVEYTYDNVRYNIEAVNINDSMFSITSRK